MSTGGADREFTISLNLDRSAGQASAEQQIAMLQRIEAASDRLSKALEQQARESAQIRQTVHKASEDAKTAKTREAEQQRTETAARIRAKQEADERASLARQDAEFQAHVDRVIAQHRRAAAASAMAAKQQLEGYADFFDSFNEGFRGEVVSSIDYGATRVKTFGDGLKGLAAAAAALGPALGILSQIGQAAAKGRQEWSESAKVLREINDRLRERAALEGKGAPTAADAAAFAASRVASGLSAEGAHQFGIQFDSAVATASDANMSPAERKKLGERAAIFAARTNKPGDTAAIGATGNLAGTLARFQQGGTAEQVLAQMDRISAIQVIGEGTNAEQGEQLNKVLTYLVSPDGKGLARSPQEAAALVAMMSNTRPVGEAATGVQQLGRSLRGFQHRIAHSPAGSQADFLKSAGINENQTILESLDKLVPVLAKAEASGRAPDAFLKQFIGSDEEVTAIVSAYRATKQGSAGKIRAAAAAPLDMAATAAKEQDFLRSPSARMSINEAKVDQAKAQQGEKIQQYEILKQQAEAELIASGELGTPMAGITNLVRGFTTASWLTGVSGEEQAIDEKITEMLDRKGIRERDPARQFMTGGRDNMMTRGFEYLFGTQMNVANLASGARQTAVTDALNSVAPETGDWTVSSGGSDWGQEATDQLKEINMTLKKMAGGPITAPVPGGGRSGRSW